MLLRRALPAAHFDRNPPGHGKSGYPRDLHATKGKATSKAIIYHGDFSDAEDVKRTATAPEAQKGVRRLAISIKVSEAE